MLADVRLSTLRSASERASRRSRGDRKAAGGRQMARKKPKPPPRKAPASNAAETRDEDAGPAAVESGSQGEESKQAELRHEGTNEEQRGDEGVVENTRLEDERHAEAVPPANAVDPENDEREEWIAKLREENETLHVRLREAQEIQTQLQEAVEERDAKIEELQARFMERAKVDEEKKENAVSGLEKQRESMNRLQERLSQLKKEQEEAERVKKEAWVELRKRVQAVVDSVCQPLQ